MAEHNETGEKGERLAVEYLKGKGYRLLETNWRYRRAEVDIFAKDEEANILLVVEVKTRSSDAFGTPDAFVDAKKERLLADAASVYATSIGHDWEIRFDIIAVLLGESPSITHYEDAFFPYDF